MPELAFFKNILAKILSILAKLFSIFCFLFLFQETKNSPSCYPLKLDFGPRLFKSSTESTPNNFL